jgi:ADP-heptose:LPS heptosyltransferase
MEIRHIVISRTDAIGDVVLTLPMAGFIKKQMPSCRISFLGRTYTEPIIKRAQYIDDFINWDQLAKLSIPDRTNQFSSYSIDAIIHVFPFQPIAKMAKQAKVPIRIGTSHRLFHLLNCNKLINLGRKKSNLHEAQLNIKLLKPFNLDGECSLNEITSLYGLSKDNSKNERLKELLDTERFNLILHPTSRGSAREWGFDNFSKLIELLPKNQFKLFITGTEDDGQLIKEHLLNKHDDLNDLTGKLSLEELIDFISYSDGLVSASTGPLHIAAALGKHALGLYAPMRPIHPERWAPIGEKADYLSLNKQCNKCKNDHHCPCIEAIQPSWVMEKLIAIQTGE